jgi:hypothetical protein
VPKKNEKGDSIVSAGEVAAYALCPESWRLEYLQANEPSAIKYPEQSEAGLKLHREWAKNVDEAQYLIKGMRLIIYLIGLAVLTLVYVMK